MHTNHIPNTLSDGFRVFGKEQYREEKAKENADSKERIHYYLSCY